jgi:hypothetical protein
VGCVFCLLQVDYQDDLDWNKWNFTAKKRILLDDANNIQCLAPAHPERAYYVSKRPVSSAGTLISSLCSTTTGAADRSTVAMTTGADQETHNHEMAGHNTTAWQNTDKRQEVRDKAVEGGRCSKNKTLTLVVVAK